MRNLALLSLWCLVPLAANCISADELAKPQSPPAADLKLLLKRMNEQDGKFADLQQKLSALTSLLTNADGVTGLNAPSRRADPNFRQIYSLNRDGTDLKEFFAAPGMITTSTPQWSHDGKSIAVDSAPQTDAVVQSRLWVYGVAGPFKGMVRYLCAGNTPSWSPDDTRLTFMINAGNPEGVEGGAWIMNADGSERRRLGEGWFTRWSPAGKEICVHAYFTQPPSLKIYNLETGDDRIVLGVGDEEDIEVIFGGANWSPDGKRLVALVRRENEQQLITIDASGDRDSIQVIYREQRTDLTLMGPPSMSPDGKEIAFGVQEMEHPDTNTRQWMNSYLYVIAADGKSQPKLLEGEKIGKINRGVGWSPDGKRIIFSSER